MRFRVQDREKERYRGFFVVGKATSRNEVGVMVWLSWWCNRRLKVEQKLRLIVVRERRRTAVGFPVVVVVNGAMVGD